MNKFKLIVTTPERVLISGEVSRVLCKNAVGEFEILAGHQPYLTATVPTVTRIDDENGESKYLFTSTGLMKVQNNEVTFCVNSAEWPEEIDQRRRNEWHRGSVQFISIVGFSCQDLQPGSVAMFPR